MFQKIKEACLQGDKEKVSESLLNDKDNSLVTEYDEDGKSLLMHAACEGHGEICELLLKHGGTS